MVLLFLVTPGYDQPYARHREVCGLFLPWPNGMGRTGWMHRPRIDRFLVFLVITAYRLDAL